MEDIFKYQRIEGALETIFDKEHVTSANIETDNLILGTADGYIHIINFSGKIIKSVKLYNRSVTAISVDIDAGKLSILSCSDNGNAILLAISSEECKEYSYPFNESLRAICMDPRTCNTIGESSSAVAASERSFVVGTRSGRLLLHKSATDNIVSTWFNQQNKDIVLFDGSGSPVTKITWHLNLLAWVDASNVRVMQISTQTAICQLSAPSGIGPSDPYPCSLVWLPPVLGDNTLLIGWGDSFRQVQIHDSNVMVFENAPTAVASVKAEWSADCIICDLQLFDVEHIVLLGYSPPSILDEKDKSMGSSDRSDLSANNQPEVIIANRMTGVYISADTLPLRGENIYGPSRYVLLSSYQCKSNRADVTKWQLKNYLHQRGGARGCSPICFVASLHDLIVARVRDINDRVGSALQRKEFKMAVNLALHDRAGLTAYQYSDLLRIYLLDMLEHNEFMNAATECVRLSDQDPILWEAWIYKFIEYHQLEAIIEVIPTDSPRLPSFVYEAVLTALLYENVKLFLEIIKRWSKITLTTISLFNHHTILKTLEQQYQLSITISNRSNTMKQPHSNDSIHANINRIIYMEALAYLYSLSNEHEKALTLTLDIQMIRDTQTSKTSSSYTYVLSRDEIEEKAEIAEYRHIFELIEKHNLFHLIQNKIMLLVKLSRKQAGRLLLSNIDKLPIRFIAQQLGPEKQLLLWYLHLIFTDETALARDIYNNEHEFGDLHARQIQLYAEFMPKIAENNSLPHTEDDCPPIQVLVTDNKSDADSDLVKFLKAGFAPALLDFALSECEKQSPPLFREMIFILAHKGNQRKALQLHLNEIGNVKLAINFIESQLDSYMKAANSKKHSNRITQYNKNGINNNLVSTQQLVDNTSMLPYYTDCQLWDDLIDHALSHPDFLNQLLDHLGICKLNPFNVISKITSNKANIPHLKLRLIRILQQLHYDIQINQRSIYLLENDELNLQRRKNQGQRKAIKVESSIKCYICLRPIVMQPVNATSNDSINNNRREDEITMIHHHRHQSGSNKIKICTSNAEIWGPKFVKQCAAITDDDGDVSNISMNRNGNGAIIFSNNLAFHRLCYANNVYNN